MESTTFLQLWYESISYLHWNTAKLLLLATLNSTVRATCFMVKYFWWLIIIIIAWVMMGTVGIITSTASIYTTALLLNLYLFFFLLAVRPSVENKNFGYFIRYLPGILILILSMTLSTLAINSFVFKMVSSTLSIPLAYANFFYLDSNFGLGSLLASIKRGFILFWSFLPAVMLFTFIAFFMTAMASLILALISSLVLGAIAPSATHYLAPLMGLFAGLITTEFFAALTSVLYTKIKHSHYSLFFK